MEAFLGQYVKTNTHSHRGRVFGKDHNFKDESDEWFEGLIPKKDPETKKEAWYHILTKDGGSVYVNESDIIEIEEPYELNNVWESYYFLPF